MRSGEMAALGEVPFGLYYGSVNSTPLFVLLAGLYVERTGDEAFLREIWPNIVRALAWIDGPGDPDGDGFFEYSRASLKGLANQGWKICTMRSFTRMANLRRGPSHSLRCRATSTQPALPQRPALSGWGRPPRRRFASKG